MKPANFVLFLFILFLCGCANNPTIYVYAKYLNSTEKEKIKAVFVGTDKYRVELNELDLPTTIANNTLLYSPLLRDPNAIESVAELAAIAGYPVQRTQGLTQGNHWYTKNSLALFLLPSNRNARQGLFLQDLVNKYEAKHCEPANSLLLAKDGSFKLISESDQDAGNNDLHSGTWKYRQYPYVELQLYGSSYADYYFQIKQFEGADKVSAIQFIELVSLNADMLPEGCSFIVGTRL
ncbi:MAG: hypothetical protein HWE26_13160 [Alteromonadaceae bacterium]|nr:hypothetical protein [Alteromonadaceae bacterium]